MADRDVTAWNLITPEYRTMHENAGDLPNECSQITQQAFFSNSRRVPGALRHPVRGLSTLVGSRGEVGMRRASALAVTAAVATALLVPLGPGSTGATPVEASGSIACDWVTGITKPRPRFVDGGTQQGRVRFSGKLGGCRDASGEGGPTPFGITGGRIKGSFLTLVNACTNGEPFISADGTATIKWTGPQRVAPTRFRSDGSSYQFDHEGAFFSLPADAINGTGDVIGSFAGGAGAVFGTADESADVIERACTPKTRGVPGSGGLRKLRMAPSLAVLFTQ